ncbi:MAG: DUF4157 domain-containing protein [Nitrosomonas sp.]|nr:DUF4157 domain-containing protein [Nitrosomonas sp.]
MEERFGHDFSDVRIHADSHAAASARSVDALAYTVGHNVVFDGGQYAPHTQNGRDLLAHELAHVVQQSSGSFLTSLSENQLEHQADEAAQSVSTGKLVPQLGTTDVVLARKPKSGIKLVPQRITLKDQSGQIAVFYDGSPVATINYKAQNGRAETSSSQGKDGNEWIVIVTPAGSDATFSVTPQYTQLYEAGRLALSDLQSDYDFEKGEEYTGKTFRISAKAEQNATPPSVPDPKASPTPQVKSPAPAQPEKKLEKPQAKSPDQLIGESSTLNFLDEEKLGNDLLKYALAGDTTTVDVTLDQIDSTDRDDVALGFVSHATTEQLAKLAETEHGRKLLLRLYDELTSGHLGNDEKEQAERLMQARTQRTDPSKFIEPDKKTMVIPFSSIGFTKLSSASLTVKRLHNGKIWIKSHMKVEHWKDAKNLPTKDFALGLDGAELDPDDIVGLYLYDEGGKVVHVPAIYLLQLGNQEDTKAYSMMGEAVFTGLTLGLGGGAAVGGKVGTEAWAARILSSGGEAVVAEGASAGVWAARGLATLKWADRGAAAFGAASTLINDHRGLILQHFNKDGEEFLSYWQKVETVVAYYGLARGAVALGQTAASLRTSLKNIRTRKAQLKGLSAKDEAALDDTIRQTEKTLDDLENAEKNAPKASNKSTNVELGQPKEPTVIKNQGDAVKFVEEHPPKEIIGEPGHRKAPVGEGHAVWEIPGGGCELHSSPPHFKIPCPQGMEDIDDAFNRLEQGKIPQEGTLTKWQSHHDASRNRDALGVKGSDFQSTHGAPRSALRDVPGYDPEAALTQLMAKGSHTEMDSYWKSYARAQVSKGNKTWTVGEMFDVVSESIKRTPNMEESEKFTLIRRFKDELLELGLKNSDQLRLPWSK